MDVVGSVKRNKLGYFKR